MERSFENAVATADRADGPVSEHLGSFVELLIQQKFVAAVVCVKALHAAAFDRWLAQHHVDPADAQRSPRPAIHAPTPAVSRAGPN